MFHSVRALFAAVRRHLTMKAELHSNTVLELRPQKPTVSDPAEKFRSVARRLQGRSLAKLVENLPPNMLIMDGFWLTGAAWNTAKWGLDPPSGRRLFLPLPIVEVCVGAGVRGGAREGG